MKTATYLSHRLEVVIMRTYEVHWSNGSRLTDTVWRWRVCDGGEMASSSHVMQSRQTFHWDCKL